MTVPIRLNWSPKCNFSCSGLENVCVRVIQQASTPANVREYLKVALLEDIWPTLNVGPFLALRGQTASPSCRRVPTQQRECRPLLKELIDRVSGGGEPCDDYVDREWLFRFELEKYRLVDRRGQDHRLVWLYGQP